MELLDFLHGLGTLYFGTIAEGQLSTQSRRLKAEAMVERAVKGSGLRTPAAGRRLAQRRECPFSTRLKEKH